MDSDQHALSAVDAVRCFYLARTLEKRGETEAAERWNEKWRRWAREQTRMRGEQDD
jgi:hypothetical protein